MLNMQEVAVSGTGPLLVLSPVDFVDVEYHAGLLLPVPFDGSITEHTEYVNACQYGYEAYFEVMLTGETFETSTFEAHFYTRTEVVKEVVDNMTKAGWSGLDSLAWRAGFLLGWLSALALTDAVLADLGVQVLLRLVKREQVVSSNGGLQ